MIGLKLIEIQIHSISLNDRDLIGFIISRLLVFIRFEGSNRAGSKNVIQDLTLAVIMLGATRDPRELMRVGAWIPERNMKVGSIKLHLYQSLFSTI